MIKHLLLLIIGLSITFPIFACSIDLTPISFCEHEAYYKKNLIASGKIIRKIDRGYVIKLHTVYKGEETRSEIKIFEQADWDCNGINFSFNRKTLGQLGQVILFVTAPVGIQNYEPWYEPDQYYNLYSELSSSIGLKPLLKKGDIFEGLFSPGVEQINISQVAQALQTCEIENLLPEPRVICEDLPVKIYPIPAKNQVFIDNLDDSYEELRLYDIRGKIVYQSQDLSRNEVISAQDYSSGVYFILLRSRVATLRKKIVFID